ncbi:hypothetical protein [Metabacillus sp. Hm71]|uniref:hypothetical protein n=1 Tax=Metabacillus sp. Hm71 TaxID=3450743 RepID=UPI003F42BC87
MKVEQQLNEEITITLHKDESKILLSLAEYFTRHEFKDETVSPEEINFATVLTNELESYLNFKVEVINYINSSYNFDPEAADNFVKLFVENLSKVGSVKL